MTELEKQPEMVLCIPGPWKTHSELVQSIVKDSGGYIFAGRVLLHMESHFSCELIHERADPNMSRAFYAAGPHWRGSVEMQRIGSHESVVYLVGRGGSRDAAQKLMQCGLGLLNAGGLGVKIESTGLAHSPDDWRSYCGDFDSFTAHRALVVYLTGAEVHSCGMHNLGLPDALTPGGKDQATAVELLRVFTWYLFAEGPVINNGQTFSVAAGAPIYRITDHPGWDYGPDSLFTNPYGAWRLVPT